MDLKRGRLRKVTILISAYKLIVAEIKDIKVWPACLLTGCLFLLDGVGAKSRPSRDPNQVVCTCMLEQPGDPTGYLHPRHTTKLQWGSVPRQFSPTHPGVGT